jgi:drug/metabolite transporter (DMT)-like permease
LWNAALKREERPEAASVGAFAACAGVGWAAAVLAPGPGIPSAEGWAWALAAGLCEAGYIVSYARALSAADLGVTYPIARGGALALTWPLAALLFGEPATPLQAAGAIAVGGGLWAVSRRSATPVAPLEDEGADPSVFGPPPAARPRSQRNGIAWAALAACFICGYQLLYRGGIRAGATPTGLFALSSAVALPFIFGVLPREELRWLGRRARQGGLTLFVMGATSAASFLLVLHAMRLASTGEVATLRNVSVFFAQVLGVALGERRTALHWLGGALIVGGGISVAWPH